MPCIGRPDGLQSHGMDYSIVVAGKTSARFHHPTNLAEAKKIRGFRHRGSGTNGRQRVTAAVPTTVCGEAFPGVVWGRATRPSRAGCPLPHCSPRLTFLDARTIREYCHISGDIGHQELAPPCAERQLPASFQRLKRASESKLRHNNVQQKVSS
jgi:hypothetical protein